MPSLFCRVSWDLTGREGKRPDDDDEDDDDKDDDDDGTDDVLPLSPFSCGGRVEAMQVVVLV